jgi:hypothetical protein
MTTRDDLTAPSHDGGVRAGTHAPVSYPNAAEGREEAFTVGQSTTGAGPTTGMKEWSGGAVPVQRGDHRRRRGGADRRGWRAGTDANANGVRARALFGSRFLPWSRIDSLVVGERNRVYARTTADSAVRLPAVSPADLPKLVAASGEQLSQ